MKERLQDLGDARDRAFIGTMHGPSRTAWRERRTSLNSSGPQRGAREGGRRDPYLSDALRQIEDPKVRWPSASWMQCARKVSGKPTVLLTGYRSVF